MATVVGNPMPVGRPTTVLDGMQIVAGLQKVFNHPIPFMVYDPFKVQVRELRQIVEAITGFDQRNK